MLDMKHEIPTRYIKHLRGLAEITERMRLQVKYLEDIAARGEHRKNQARITRAILTEIAKTGKEFRRASIAMDRLVDEERRKARLQEAE